MRTMVCTTVSVNGIHCWPQAPDIEPSVAFLASPHRHVFVVKAWVEVFHDDRDVEFITLGRKVKGFLLESFGDEAGVCQFGHLSCEAIARGLVLAYDLVKCEVWEDGENGATVERTK